MTVNRYLFQSPSSSQVQVGRPDPSVKQEDTSNTSSNNSAQLDTSSQKSQPVRPVQTESINAVEEVPSTLSAGTPLLDVYA